MVEASPFNRLHQKNIEFQGLKFNAYEGGNGRPLLLVHGSGPGASSIGNWRLVLDELAEHYHVLAIDLIGFGESDRKPEPPYFDFNLWVEQSRAALDYLGDDNIGIIGHSLAGAIVLKLAATDDRVGAVLTTGAMGAPMKVNEALVDHVWTCPRSRKQMQVAAGSLVYDKSLITDSYLDFRMQVIGTKEYQDYFDTMFDGSYERFIEAATLDEETLAAVEVPVMMLHGRNDLPIPAETGSVALFPKLPQADLLLLYGCGHSIAMERKKTFLAAIKGHFV
tara:strand:+ start:13855 stop:14691 length:837 start_codon:yes stop_codon:yes gene_type:complete